jgi:hypothetical protein
VAYPATRLGAVPGFVLPLGLSDGDACGAYRFAAVGHTFPEKPCAELLARIFTVRFANSGAALVAQKLAALRNRNLPPPAQPAVPQFTLFFSDAAGFGIEMVQALDAAHGQDIARAQHPTGRIQRGAHPAQAALNQGVTNWPVKVT